MNDSVEECGSVTEKGHKNFRIIRLQPNNRTRDLINIEFCTSLEVLRDK
jgi:hypothetical protein